jgi:Flp pilus assembly pilin Flp
MGKKNKAQNLTEYAIILGLVGAALIAMQVYMKRGVQGKLRDLSNQISPTQYERGNTTASYDITRTTNVEENQGRAAYTRNTLEDTTTRTGSETVTGN